MQTYSTIHNVHMDDLKTSPKWLRSLVRWVGVLGVVTAGAVGLSGCAAELVPADAPVDYAAYPSSYYDGHVVYYVEGRWYYPRGNRWYYYNRVPAELSRRRPTVAPVHRAQPAYRQRAYGRPGYGRGGGPPPAYEAPPAHRR